MTGSNPIQLYDPLNGFAPYPNNKGVPIVNPVAKFLFANPKLYPLPNATPSDGIVNNDLQGPQRRFEANNQGDIKIEYDPRNSDKITGFLLHVDRVRWADPVVGDHFSRGKSIIRPRSWARTGSTSSPRPS